MSVNFADYIIVGRDPFYDYNNGDMQPENAGPMLGAMTRAPDGTNAMPAQPQAPQAQPAMPQQQPSVTVDPPAAQVAIPPADRIQQAIQQQRAMSPEQRAQNFNTGVRAGLQRGAAMAQRNLGYNGRQQLPAPLITNTPGRGFQDVARPTFIDRMRENDGPGRGNSFWDQVARHMSQPRPSASAVETTRVRPAQPSTAAGLRITNTPGDGFQDVSERAMRERDRMAVERYRAQHPVIPQQRLNSGLRPIALIPPEPRIWAPVQRADAPVTIDPQTQRLGFDPARAGQYDRARRADENGFYQQNYGNEARAVQEENRQVRNRRR